MTTNLRWSAGLRTMCSVVRRKVWALVQGADRQGGRRGGPPTGPHRTCGVMRVPRRVPAGPGARSAADGRVHAREVPAGPADIPTPDAVTAPCWARGPRLWL